MVTTPKEWKQSKNRKRRIAPAVSSSVKDTTATQPQHVPFNFGSQSAAFWFAVHHVFLCVKYLYYITEFTELEHYRALCVCMCVFFHSSLLTQQSD